MAQLLTNLLFEPKGKHDPKVAYNIKDTVMSADGSQVYFALKAVPIGIQLNNTEYWKLQIDLSVTKAEAEAATAAANAAAETANTAAANVKEDVDRLSEENLLHSDAIKGTVQTITFKADGTPAKVEHVASGVTVRTDTFTYSGDIITEVRTTATGTLRIVTNVKTLSVEVE